MFNIIDIVIAVLVVVQLTRSLGGPVKIAKGLLIIFIALIVFGLVARLLLEAPLPDQAKKPIKDSYFYKFSMSMVRFVYPSIEKGAPQVDSFIKAKILSLPKSEITPPSITLPAKIDLPKVKMPKIDVLSQ